MFTECEEHHFSIPHRVHLPFEAWNGLYLENPATDLLKDSLW
jgi:hypothetical protein